MLQVTLFGNVISVAFFLHFVTFEKSLRISDMAITQDTRLKLAEIASRRAFPAICDPVEKVVSDEVETKNEPAQSAQCTAPTTPSNSTGTPSPKLAPVSEKAKRSERIPSVGKDSTPTKKAVTHPSWCQGQKCCAFNSWKCRCNHEKAGIEGFAGMTTCPASHVWARGIDRQETFRATHTGGRAWVIILQA